MKAVRIVLELLLAIAFVSVSSNYYLDTQKANEARGKADLQVGNLRSALSRSLAEQYAARECFVTTRVLTEKQMDECLEDASGKAWEQAQKIGNRMD